MIRAVVKTWKTSLDRYTFRNENFVLVVLRARCETEAPNTALEETSRLLNAYSGAIPTSGS